MNSVSTTGMVAFGGTQLDGVVIWFCQIVHLPSPDTATATAIGIGFLMAVHKASQFINARWPVKVAVPAPVAAPAPVVTSLVAQGATP